MLLADLAGEALGAAGSQYGELRQWLLQPIDRDGSNSAVDRFLFHGVLDLFRDLLGCHQNPRFEIRLSFHRLRDLAPNSVLIQSRIQPVAASFEYKMSATNS